MMLVRERWVTLEALKWNGSKGEVRIGYRFLLVDHPHSSSSDHDSSASSVSHRHPS